MRQPRALAKPLEPRLRSAITATVRRGKVECRMSLQRPRSDSTDALNLERLAHYVELSRQIRLVDDSAQPPSSSSFLFSNFFVLCVFNSQS